MEKRLSISVLIPVCNAAPWLDACLNSVMNQTHQVDEVILVDDGSTDGSAALCDAWAAKDQRIRVIHQPNKGVSVARNAALDAANADLLMPVDADDWLEPTYTACLLALMQQDDVPVAACNHWIEYQNSRKPCFPNQTTCILTDEQALAQTLYHGLPDVSCWGKLYRREVFDGLRYPDGLLYEDTWLFADVMLAAKRMAWTNKTLYHYRIRSDSISRSTWSDEKMDFIAAVQHMTTRIRQNYPRLEKGCIRREAHALLSVRRYFVDCPDALKKTRDDLEKTVVGYTRQIICDPSAPWRDKAALLALRCGPWAYDWLWKMQRKT